MGKRLPYTPKSQIRSALRNLFLRSREHQAVLKRDGYTCQECGAKQSKAKGREVKVQVHHEHPINWERIFDVVYEELLVAPIYMVTLCEDCHDKQRDENGR